MATCALCPPQTTWFQLLLHAFASSQIHNHHKHYTDPFLLMIKYRNTKITTVLPWHPRGNPRELLKLNVQLSESSASYVPGTQKTHRKPQRQLILGSTDRRYGDGGRARWKKFGMRKKLEWGRSHQTCKREKSEGQLKRAVGEREREPLSRLNFGL